MKLTYSPEFLNFYARYPRQTHKWAAFLAWQAVSKRFEPTAILAALELAKIEWRGREARFIEHPATWLRATDFDDEFEGVDDPEPLPLLKVTMFDDDADYDRERAEILRRRMVQEAQEWEVAKLRHRCTWHCSGGSDGPCCPYAEERRPIVPDIEELIGRFK